MTVVAYHSKCNHKMIVARGFGRLTYYYCQGCETGVEPGQEGFDEEVIWKSEEEDLHRKQSKTFTPPRYDEVYFKGVEWLDSSDD